MAEQDSGAGAARAGVSLMLRASVHGAIAIVVVFAFCWLEISNALAFDTSPRPTRLRILRSIVAGSEGVLSCWIALSNSCKNVSLPKGFSMILLAPNSRISSSSSLLTSELEMMIGISEERSFPAYRLRRGVV